MPEPQARLLVAGGPVHRRVNRMLAALVGVVIGAGGGFGYLLVQLRQHSVGNCRQIEIVKGGLRATLQEAERFALSSPVRGASERQRIAAFYRDALGRLRPRRC